VRSRRAVDIRKVKKLIELLEHSGIDELEIREGEESVRISRHAPAPAVAAPAPSVAGAPPARAPAPEPEPFPEPAEDPETPPGHVVTSPMVGTFYEASSPGARPFVTLGQRIEAGDTLCIIEAMKMMNQIESDVAGTVRSIEVDNGEPVEYGQVLFIIG